MQGRGDAIHQAQCNALRSCRTSAPGAPSTAPEPILPTQPHCQVRRVPCCPARRPLLLPTSPGPARLAPGFQWPPTSSCLSPRRTPADAARGGGHTPTADSLRLSPQRAAGTDPNPPAGPRQVWEGRPGPGPRLLRAQRPGRAEPGRCAPTRLAHPGWWRAAHPGRQTPAGRRLLGG